jgi:hypothetical protein
MLLRSVALITALLTLIGCTAPTSLKRTAVAVPTPPDNEVVQAAQFTAIATAQQQLVQGSPAEQAEVLASAKNAWEANRQGSAALRYALALATPGHPGRDLSQAQHLLREALARPELLSSAERSLAVVEQQRVEDELKLLAENARLVAEQRNARERSTNTNTNISAATARRLQAEIDENARLRAALEDAQTKLSKITTIERSISDRQTNEGRNP